MRIKEFLTNDRAVSPVVGVALLIAITVILAAVIGGVVLGLGTSSADAPQASLAVEEGPTDGNATIHHNGGSALENVEVRDSDGTHLADLDGLSAGTTSDEFDVAGVDDISVVWDDPNSNDEAVLGTFDVSDI